MHIALAIYFLSKHSREVSISLIFFFGGGGSIFSTTQADTKEMTTNMQLKMEIVEVRDKVENKTPTTLEISHRKRGLNRDNIEKAPVFPPPSHACTLTLKTVCRKTEQAQHCHYKGLTLKS